MSLRLVCLRSDILAISWPSTGQRRRGAEHQLEVSPLQQTDIVEKSTWPRFVQRR